MRKTIWALGHVRLEADQLVVQDAQGADLPVPATYLEADFSGAWRWELDAPRRFVFASGTRIDLAVLPPDISLGQLATAIDRCQAADRNYSVVILSAWEAMGRLAVGQRIVEYLNSPDGYVAVLAARAAHDREAMPTLLKRIEGLKGDAP